MGAGLVGGWAPLELTACSPLLPLLEPLQGYAKPFIQKSLYLANSCSCLGEGTSCTVFVGDTKLALASARSLSV